MAIAFVQSASGSTGTTGTTVTAVYPGVLTSGSKLYVAGYFNSASFTATFADTHNTWTNIGSPLRGTGALAAYSLQIASAPNTSTSALTVTMTTSGTTTDRAIAIHEVTGVGGLDVSAYSNISGTSTLLSSSLSASTATSTYWLAVAIVAGSTSGVMGGGFTQRERVNFGNNYTADEIAATVAAQQAQFGVVGTTSAMSFLGAFTASVSAPTTLFLT